MDPSLSFFNAAASISAANLLLCSSSKHCFKYPISFSNADAATAAVAGEGHALATSKVYGERSGGCDAEKDWLEVKRDGGGGFDELDDWR